MRDIESRGDSIIVARAGHSGGEDGRPAYAACRARNQHRLTWFDIRPHVNELAAGHGNERERSCVDEIHALRHLGEKPGFYGAEFGVRVISPGENLVSYRKTFNTRPKLFDRA